MVIRSLTAHLKVAAKLYTGNVHRFCGELVIIVISLHDIRFHK